MGIQYLLGVLTSLSATFLIWIGKKVIEVMPWESNLSGEWSLLVYNDESEFLHKEEIKLKHNLVLGKIMGKDIVKYRHKKHRLEAKIEGTFNGQGMIITSFVLLNLKLCAIGCMEFVDDNCFRGYYLNWNKKTNKVEEGKIKMIKRSAIKSYEQLNKY